MRPRLRAQSAPGCGAAGVGVAFFARLLSPQGRVSGRENKRHRGGLGLSFTGGKGGDGKERTFKQVATARPTVKRLFCHCACFLVRVRPRKYTEAPPAGAP